LVGLTGYYLDEIKGRDSFTSQDIIETVESSRETLNSSHVSTYIGRLDEDDDYFTEVESGYRLTYPGLDYYGELVDIPEHSREVRHGSFIEVTEVSEEFYETLIRDINKCYRIGVDDATFVLTRKLLENLVIDLLRRQYGDSKEGVELYYSIENGQFKKFSDLLQNLEDKMDDFAHFSNRMDTELVTEMDEFRDSANSDAHSIEVDRTEEEMERFSQIATNATDTLLYVRRELNISAENGQQ
jgi:PHP family Zn ribbon phosphoesterase